MKSWWIRSNEADIVAPHMDTLGFMVGHWTDDLFTKRIKDAIATADRLKKKLILWQLLWRATEVRLSEAITSPEFFDWNLRVRVSGMGLDCLSGLDCEPYSQALVRAHGFPLSLALRNKIAQVAPLFDIATPGVRSPTTNPKTGLYTMYAEFTKLGRRNMLQGTYRNVPAFKPTVGTTSIIGVTVSKNPPNHEYMPAEAIDPERWFNQGNRDICYFPIGDIVATAKEFAGVMEETNK
jgi:hypothetical protein